VRRDAEVRVEVPGDPVEDLVLPRRHGAVITVSFGRAPTGLRSFDGTENGICRLESNDSTVVMSRREEGSCRPSPTLRFLHGQRVCSRGGFT
jgi:hypothetical protein